MSTRRTGAPGGYDRGKLNKGPDDPTFWEVFNERTNPLPDGDGDERRTAEIVYFLHCPAIGRVKVGRSRNVEQRRRALSREIGGLPTVLLGVLSGGARVEALMHRRFAASRVSGEWFRDDILEDAERLIRADREFFAVG